MTIYKAIIFNAITECLAMGDWHKKYLLMKLARNKGLVVNLRCEKDFVLFLADRGIRPKKSLWGRFMKLYAMPKAA